MEMLDVIKKLQEIAQQEVAPPGREKQVKALKGKVDNPYAVAWSSYNKSKGKKEAIGDELADEGGFKDIDTAKSEKARLYALLKDKKEKYNATMAGQLDYDEGELQDEIQKIERALGISDESTTKEQSGDMVHIKKGDKEYTVPASAVEKYKSQGFEIVAPVTVSPEQMSAYRKWYDKWSKLDTVGGERNYADGIFYAYMDSGTTDLDAVSKQDPNKEAFDELERIFGSNNIEAIGHAIDKAEDLGHESTQEDEIKELENELGIGEAEQPELPGMTPQTKELYINGMTTEEDVISMIQDTIDAGKGDDAKDYLEQFKQYLFVKSGGQAESKEPAEEQFGAKMHDPQGNAVDYFIKTMGDLDLTTWNKEMELYFRSILGQIDQETLYKAIDAYKDETGAFETKALNTEAMKKEDKKPLKEAITMTADSPEEAGMLMQIMKLAGVQQVTPDMIGAEEPTVAPDAEVPADNDADAEMNHDAEGHDHSSCSVCGDDAVGSNEMGRMRDMVSQNDGGDQAEETFANEPDEKVDDVDTLVNVHSGGLNKQKQQVRKEYPGDNPLAIKEEPTEEELSNSLRTQYEGFKKSYQEATKVTETHKGKSHKGKDHDKDGDVDSKDYMKSKDIAIKKAMKK